MRHLSARAVTYGLIVLLGLFSALPNLLSPTQLEKLPAWYAANQLTLGFDLSGGSYLLLGVDVESAPAGISVDDVMEQSLAVVRRRLDESGLVEPSITRQGQDRIEVQLPGVTDPARIRQLLGTTAKMDFHWLAAAGTANVLQLEGSTPGERYRLEREVAMAGRHVRDARMAFDPATAEPKVTFRLDNEGARIFSDMTSANVGRQLAVVLDGKVITAPAIRTPITGGSGEISGGFSSSEAADLAVMLRAGALPAELQVLEERAVGPNFGSDSIRMGMVSGIVGGLLVLAFMLAMYRQWGLIAWVGLGGKGIAFMRAGLAGLVISAVLSTASVVLMVTPGMQYGIDFSGGALLEVHTAAASIGELRQAFTDAGLQELAIQEFGSAQDFQLRMPVAGTEEESSALLQALKDAVLTVALDLTKTLGFFVVTGLEFNLTAVAALLALIGSSVNDKVVVLIASGRTCASDLTPRSNQR